MPTVRTKDQTDDIWDQMKSGDPMPEPISCPCCGSENLYLGHHEATRLGVKCNDCGLQMGREYPDQLTEKMANDVDYTPDAVTLLNDLDTICLWIAIENWNKRS
jgi:hypothetical protein